MKPVSSSLTAAIYSLGNTGGSAIEDLFPSDAMVIVIQDIARNSPPLLPIRCDSLPDFRVNTEVLPSSPYEAKRAYFIHPPSLGPESIDVLA